MTEQQQRVVNVERVRLLRQQFKLSRPLGRAVQKCLQGDDEPPVFYSSRQAILSEEAYLNDDYAVSINLLKSRLTAIGMVAWRMVRLQIAVIGSSSEIQLIPGDQPKFTAMAAAFDELNTPTNISDHYLFARVKTDRLSLAGAVEERVFAAVGTPVALPVSFDMARMKNTDTFSAQADRLIERPTIVRRPSS